MPNSNGNLRNSVVGHTEERSPYHVMPIRIEPKIKYNEKSSCGTCSIASNSEGENSECFNIEEIGYFNKLAHKEHLEVIRETIRSQQLKYSDSIDNSSVLVSIIVNDSIYLANLGDSLACLVERKNNCLTNVTILNKIHTWENEPYAGKTGSKTLAEELEDIRRDIPKLLMPTSRLVGKLPKGVPLMPPDISHHSVSFRENKEMFLIMASNGYFQHCNGKTKADWENYIYSRLEDFNGKAIDDKIFAQSLAQPVIDDCLGKANKGQQKIEETTIITTRLGLSSGPNAKVIVLCDGNGSSVLSEFLSADLPAKLEQVSKEFLQAPVKKATGSQVSEAPHAASSDFKKPHEKNTKEEKSRKRGVLAGFMRFFNNPYRPQVTALREKLDKKAAVNLPGAGDIQTSEAEVQDSQADYGALKL